MRPVQVCGANSAPSERVCANALRTVYEPDDIFYTWEAAEREGREAINTVSN
ncbi:MAG: hypothetical protein AAFR62_03580 [Cyanobacteria bacterium J06629_2]